MLNLINVAIATNRICLREFKSDEAEIESILKFAGDPIVARYSSWGPLAPTEVAEWIHDSMQARIAQPRVGYPLLMTLKDSQEVIGHISLNIRSLKNREGEIGYSIRPDLWKQGYATERSIGSHGNCSIFQ